MTGPSDTSRLLSLPAEIRNGIWKQLFTLDPVARNDEWNQDPQVTRVPISHNPKKARTTSVLAALLVCRQIRSEAWTLFYTENLLSFQNPSTLFNFLRAVRTPQRECIRAIHVANLGSHWSCRFAVRAFALLTICHNLQELYIDFEGRLIAGRSFFDDLSESLSPTCLLIKKQTHRSGSMLYLDLVVEGVYTGVLSDIKAALASLGNVRGLKAFQIRADMFSNRKREADYVKSVDAKFHGGFWRSEKELDWPLVEVDSCVVEELRRTVMQPRPRFETRYQRAMEGARIEQRKRARMEEHRPSASTIVTRDTAPIVVSRKRNIDQTDDEEDF